MSATDAQKRATAAYRKKHVKQLAVSFYPADAALWAHLEQRPNKAGYVKELIRRDMAGSGGAREGAD